MRAGEMCAGVAGFPVVEHCRCMSTRRIVILVALWVALTPAWPVLRGAEFVPPPNPPRFLLIVEKSDATLAQGLDLPQTMFDIVYRGANGHLPDGGVFEIWVFGAETVFRGFPPEMLMPDNRLALASKASAYVRKTNSSGVADIAKLVDHVRGASELGMELTILLVTAVDTRLAGMARDAEINGVMDIHAEVQRAAGRPFITAIRIQDGVPVAAAVNESPFTMAVPPMPPSQLTPEERERRVAAARQARIEREKPAPAPETVVAAPVTPRPRRDIPDEEREGAIILKGAAKPGPATPPPVSAAVESNPTAASESSASPPQALSEPERPIENAQQATPPEAAALPGAKAFEAPAGKPVAQRSEESVTEAPTVPPSVDTPVPNAALAPVPVPDAGLTNPVPQVAVTVPVRTWLTAGGLFVAGLCFFVVAALLTWVLMRRARAASGPSFITRSINQRRE